MASLIQSLELIQGDSSAIYRFGNATYANLSGGDWVGTATIRNGKIDSAITLTKTLPLTETLDKFVFQLSPTESNGLTPNKYFLSIEIKNMVLGYRKEVVQCPLVIKPSGVNN